VTGQDIIRLVPEEVCDIGSWTKYASRVFRHFQLYLFLASVVLLAGCAHHADDSAFEVTLVNVKPAPGGGVGESALDCEIRLQNGSPESMSVEGGRHRIYLNGIYVGQGLNNQTVEVPRLGTTTQHVTVYLSTFRMAGSLFKIYEEHRAEYRLESTIYVRVNGHSRSISATRSGTVDSHALAPPSAPDRLP
jgi:LEA14-like dessication related protein